MTATIATDRSAGRRRRRRLHAVQVLDDVYRVDAEDRTVGYIQRAGRVYVALEGSIYNTSCEVAQCLDLDSAIARLERAG